MAKPCYRLAPNGGSLEITSELYFLSTHFNYSEDSITRFNDFVKRKLYFSYSCANFSEDAFLLAHIQADDLFSQRKYRRGGYRKLIDAHGEKCLSEICISGKLTADAYPCAVFMGVFGRYAYHSHE